VRTLDAFALQVREKKGIRKATRMIKERFPFKDVILFGSKARGDDDPDSDIDLLLEKQHARWTGRRGRQSSMPFLIWGWSMT